MQSDWLNNALSPVIYGDILLSIKINTHIKIRMYKFSYNKDKS